jgi:hypothetical protein
MHGAQSGEEITKHEGGVKGQLSQVTIGRQRMEDASSPVSTVQESISSTSLYMRRYSSVARAMRRSRRRSLLASRAVFYLC